jgi:hypothetical protein
MSSAGRTARAIIRGLMETDLQQPRHTFFHYLGDRLRITGMMTVPPLPDLVRQAAAAA